MTALTKAEYKRYCEAHKAENDSDPHSFGDVKTFLNGLVGKCIQSTDGCYIYEVTKTGFLYQNEEVGTTIFSAMVGWACRVNELVELIEELNCDGDYDRALWVCGFGDTDITNSDSHLNDCDPEDLEKTPMTLRDAMRMASTKKPTQKHRPAVWECMLGTVYAYDGNKIKYFDYDHEGALAYAGINWESEDLRWAKKPGRYSYCGGGVDEPGMNKKILWTLK